MKTTLAALLVLTLATPLRAQNPQLPNVQQALSLADAIAIASDWNPVLRQTANDRRSAAWGVRNAYATFLPSASISGSVGYQGAGSQRILSTEFSSPATKGSSYNIGMNWAFNANTLMQPALRRAQLQAAEASVTNMEITVTSQVVQQYVTVLQAEDEVELAETQFERNDQALRLARARRDVGQGTLLDVRNAEVARGRSQVQLIRERQDVRVEKLRLFQQLGIPAPTDPAVVVLTDSFPVVPLDWTLEQLLELTRDGNPSLASLRSSEDAARWQARAARSSYLPSISASVGWSGFTQSFVNASDLDAQIESQRRGADGARASCEFDNVLIGIVNQGGNNFPTNDCTSIVFTDADAALFRSQNSNFPFDFRNNPFSARLTVSLPIFSNFNRPLQVSQANAALDDAREAVRSLALRLEGDVSQAYYTMLTNFQTIEIQETNRIAAGEALQLATEQYRLGSGTFIQLLDAQVAAQQAESSYIRSLYDYHRSVAQLESAVGRRLR